MLASQLVDRWEEAREAFARSLEHWRAIGQEVASVESKAGLAYATWRGGDTVRARGVLEEVMQFLERGSLSGAKEPLRVYVMCHRMLKEDGDMRAQAVLQRARELLQAQAEGIGDLNLRRSFLERVAVNREIVED
jgi:hypothetical protein